MHQLLGKEKSRNADIIEMVLHLSTNHQINQSSRCYSQSWLISLHFQSQDILYFIPRNLWGFDLSQATHYHRYPYTRSIWISSDSSEEIIFRIRGKNHPLLNGRFCITVEIQWSGQNLIWMVLIKHSLYKFTVIKSKEKFKLKQTKTQVEMEKLTCFSSLNIFRTEVIIQKHGGRCAVMYCIYILAGMNRYAPIYFSQT